MDNLVTVERTSALAGVYKTGKFGVLGIKDTVGVTLQDMPDLVLHQVAAWADTVEEVGAGAAAAAGAPVAPGPCKSESGESASILRIEPLKWWLVGAQAPQLESDKGVTLDLSHSRTHIRINGTEAADFLNRFLPLDLREHSFPLGSVASSVIHHVGVTLWRSAAGYEMFVPRGFAVTLWHGFVEVAEQFGVEVI
jgi:heterotetrameric sarcosine oxidase gamma subunit